MIIWPQVILDFEFFFLFSSRTYTELMPIPELFVITVISFYSIEMQTKVSGIFA